MEPRELDHEMDGRDSLDKEFFGPETPDPAQFAAGGADPHAEPASPGPVPTTPAMTPAAEPVPPEAEVNSTTHGKQWKMLGRVANGPRAKQFPTIAELWKGDASSKQRALKMFLQSSEDLARAESKLLVEKSHAETVTYKKAWLTISQMKERGMSENLVCNMLTVCVGISPCSV